MLVNYFTIPAMVAEDLSATKAIKRSAGLVRKNFVDVMIKETAVRWGFGVLAGMMFIGFAAFGALFGYVYFAGDIYMTLILAIVFMVFAAIPSVLVLRTFDIVYVTLLYVFIRRKEGDITGKTAIPAGMTQELDRAYNKAQTRG
jgi:membrane-anchored glycerophosphoryl diester phosphodiesterase (GDPDase)